MTALYQLSREFLAAMEKLTELAESGEIRQEVVTDTLEGLQGELEHKALNVAKYILSLEAEAEAMKAAEKRMADRRKAVESRADSLREYLTGQLIATGITPKDSEVALSFRKSEAVVIDDEALIPQSLKKHIPEQWTPDKTAIKAALKEGEIPGAYIEKRQNLQIK